MSLKTLLLTASIGALMLANQAGAQTDETANEITDEVIVLGAKISRSLQDTATSVAVVTNLDIKEQDIINLSDILDRTANVSSNGGMTIRGIRSTNVSGAGIGTLATTYVDGSPGAGVDIWDLEQAEVFRGPQSTLQGRNTLAGAVFLTTANPTYEWTGRARAIVGTGDNTKRFGIAVGGPIIEDQVAFRIAAEAVDTAGLVDNLTLGEKADSEDSQFIRGKLLIEPQAIPDLSILASYTWDEQDRLYSPNLYTVDDPHKNRVIYSNRPSPYNTKGDLAVLTVDYDLSDALSVKSITAQNVTETIRSWDGDNGIGDIAYGSSHREVKNFTQEFRLTLDQGPLTGIAGAYYSNAKINFIEPSTSVFEFDTSSTINAGSIAAGLQSFGYDAPTAAFIASVVAPFYVDPVLIRSTFDNPSEIETMAVFSDFTYEYTDRLRLFGGFRYDSEKQDIRTGSLVGIVQELPNRTNLPAQLAPFYDVFDIVNAQASASASQASSQPVELKSPTFGAFLPKVGISYDLADERNISFIVQRGYRSGGVGVNAARASNFEFDQEFIWNYELSWRSRWLDNALTLNANAFYIDWTDQQVTVQLSGNVYDTETVNAGSSRIYGFEIESDYHVSDSVDIYGSIGYANTKFNEFSALIGGALVDLSGNVFPQAPDWTLAGGVTWKPSGGYFVNVNGNYNSAAFRRADVVQTEHDRAARFLGNFKIGWENDNYGVFVTGKNVFNDKQIDSLNESPYAMPGMPDLVYYTAPQTFAVQLEAKF